MTSIAWAAVWMLSQAPMPDAGAPLPVLLSGTHIYWLVRESPKRASCQEWTVVDGTPGGPQQLEHREPAPKGSWCGKPQCTGVDRTFFLLVRSERSLTVSGPSFQRLDAAGKVFDSSGYGCDVFLTPAGETEQEIRWTDGVWYRGLAACEAAKKASAPASPGACR